MEMKNTVKGKIPPTWGNQVASEYFPTKGLYKKVFTRHFIGYALVAHKLDFQA